MVLSSGDIVLQYRSWYWVAPKTGDQLSVTEEADCGKVVQNAAGALHWLETGVVERRSMDVIVHTNSG